MQLRRGVRAAVKPPAQPTLVRTQHLPPVRLPPLGAVVAGERSDSAAADPSMARPRQATGGLDADATPDAVVQLAGLPVAGSLMLVGSAAWAIDAVAKAAWCIEFQHDVGMGTWLHPIGVNRVLAIHNRASVVLRWLQQSFWSPPHPQLGLPDEPIFRPAWSSMDLVSPTLAGCEGGRPSAGPFTAGWALAGDAGVTASCP